MFAGNGIPDEDGVFTSLKQRPARTSDCVAVQTNCDSVNPIGMSGESYLGLAGREIQYSDGIVIVVNGECIPIGT